MLRWIFAAVFGLGGAAVLVTLSVWQVQRLSWKEERIAALEAQLQRAPLEFDTLETRERFLPVLASGRFTGPTLDVLTSTKSAGPGFRIIQKFETEAGSVLVDRGFLAEEEKGRMLDQGPVDVVGHLDDPQESDSFTPAPNFERNIWFARDVAAMAEALGSEPVLIVAARPTGKPSPRPMPVNINLPNNHLQYAITWGLMAVVWLAMTGLYVLRLRGKTA